MLNLLFIFVTDDSLR